MEPEDLLLSKREPATGTYLEPPESDPHPHACFWKIQLNIYLSSMLGSSKWSFPFKFPD